MPASPPPSRLAPPPRLATLARSPRTPLVAALAGYVLATWLDRAGRGDLHLYAWFGGWVLDGRAPYRDFFVEYPPGSMPAFLLPAAISRAHYALVFHLEMAACGALAVVAAWIVLRALRTGPLRTWVALAALAVTPLVVGHVYLYTYDAWPALLVLAGLAALLRERRSLAFALLGLAAAAKIYPLVVLLIALARVWRRDGREALVRPVLAAAAAVAAVVLPFAALAPGGVGYSLYVQAKRALQVESLGASLLLVADRLGIANARVAVGSPSSMVVTGHASTLVGALSSLLLVAAVLAALALYLRGPDRDERLVAAAAATTAGFVAFGKVLSPQYVTWLVLLVPLSPGLSGAAAGALVVVAGALGRAWWRRAHELNGVGPIVWAVLGRNLLVVATYAALAAWLGWSARRQGAGARSTVDSPRTGRSAASRDA